jgi:hypothetical protein
MERDIRHGVLAILNILANVKKIKAKFCDV